MREKRRENEAEGGEVFFFVKQGMIGSWVTWKFYYGWTQNLKIYPSWAENKSIEMR